MVGHKVSILPPFAGMGSPDGGGGDTGCCGAFALTDGPTTITVSDVATVLVAAQVSPTTIRRVMIRNLGSEPVTIGHKVTLVAGSTPFILYDADVLDEEGVKLGYWGIVAAGQSGSVSVEVERDL